MKLYETHLCQNELVKIKIVLRKKCSSAKNVDWPLKKLLKFLKQTISTRITVFNRFYNNRIGNISTVKIVYKISNDTMSLKCV